MLIPDQLQREQALDPYQSFIIQAPAGSGKTELLIQRMLVLLAKVQQPEEILAITFTRKAANEMSHRVLQALERAAHEPEPTRDPARKTWLLAQAVLQQDKQQEWQLLTNPHRLRVQTIDALCASLTRQMPILSQFGAQPEIADDPTDYYRIAVQNFMATLDQDETWSEALACLLLHLDNQHHLLEELLVNMLAKRDQWLPHLADLHLQHDLRHLLETELACIANEKLAQLPQYLAESSLLEIVELLQYAGEHLQIHQPASALLRLTELKNPPGFTAEFLPQWWTIASFLLTKDHQWRKKVDARDGFPASSDCSKQEAERRKQMKAKFTSLLEQLGQDEVLRRILFDILHLPPCHLTVTQWQALSSLIDVLRVASGFLWLVFREHNKVDYIEITQRAIQALGEQDSPSALALNLDYQLHHILVDEFQDTSATQFKLLSKLTAGWQHADGRSLFIVGDPMQSIYRFRKAEVGLFFQAEQQGINAIKLNKLTLRANFRSQSALVDWFNLMFNQVFPTLADASTGAVPYSQALGVLPNSHEPAVQIHAFCQNTAAQVQQVVDLIQQYQAIDNTFTLAVLVRARSHLIELMPALQQANIAYRAVEIESLRYKSVIQDLMALTRALLFLDDRIAWLALLRSPCCGLEHTDLHAIAGYEQHLSIWERLQRIESISLSDDGRKRVGFIVGKLQPYLANRGRKSLAAWIEVAWLQLGGPACLNHDNELADVATFFSLLDRLQQGEDLADIRQLEQKLNELFAAANSSPDVQIELMTIHKAKGLEFDVVILPCLHKEGATDSSELLLFNERPLSSGIGLVLAPIKAFHEKIDPLYRYLQLQEAQRAEQELNRLLYVAVTRAKHKLHLLAQLTLDKKQGVKPPAKNSLLAKLWPALTADIIEQALEQHVDQAEDKTMRRVNFLKRTLIDSPSALPVALAPRDQQANSLPPLFSNRSETLKHIGTLIHRLLCLLSKHPFTQWSDIVQQRAHWRISLVQLGVAPTELEFAEQTVAHALTQVVNDERGRWLLTHTHLKAQSEFALSFSDGHRMQQIIVDRTFIDSQGKRWIIDYKTTAQPALDVRSARQQYGEQLAAYARAMREICNAPIQLAVYFPLSCGWHEWPSDV